MSEKQHQCSECRAGDHDRDYNDGDDVRLYRVANPDGGRGSVRRMYLCEDHVTCMLDDGYTVDEVNN